MATIITFATSKGGSGKSVLAFNLYGAFRSMNVPVAVIDDDPQQTITKMGRIAERYGGPPLDVLDAGTDVGSLRKREDYRVIIVDTRGYATQEVNPWIQYSHVVIVPCRASLSDIGEIGTTLAKVAQARQTNPTLKAGIVLNATRYASRGFEADIRQMLESQPAPIFATQIAERVSYQRSPLDGGTVFDTNDDKAQDEIRRMGIEILNLLKT